MSAKYDKGKATQLSKSFKSTDFDCKCHRHDCNKTLVDPLLCEALEALRTISGPFVIDSGFRCKEHNEEVGGVVDSQHCLGLAADCRSLSGLNGNGMARYAEKINPFYNGGIGIYPTFAHLDIRQHRARWSAPATC